MSAYYDDRKYPIGVIFEGETRASWEECLSLAREEGLNVDLALAMEHKDGIQLCVACGIDISLVWTNIWNCYQLERIRKAHKAGVDLSKYLLREDGERWASRALQCKQLGIDPDSLLDKCTNPDEMYNLALGKAKGFDVSHYAKYNISCDAMQEVIAALEEGIELLPYVEAGFLAKQLAAIRRGIKKGVDVGIIAVQDYSDYLMNMIVDGVVSGLETDLPGSRKLSDYVKEYMIYQHAGLLPKDWSDQLEYVDLEDLIAGAS